MSSFILSPHHGALSKYISLTFYDDPHIPDYWLTQWHIMDHPVCRSNACFSEDSLRKIAIKKILGLGSFGLVFIQLKETHKKMCGYEYHDSWYFLRNSWCSMKSKETFMHRKQGTRSTRPSKKFHTFRVSNI